MNQILRTCVLLLAIAFQPQPAKAIESIDFSQGGYAILLRHALAPGTGDPANFKIDDCSTQRNLNDQGRDQARQIGAKFQELGITNIKIYSSQWCRCLETAELLGFESPTELPALNSFFRRYNERARRTSDLRKFLAEQATEGANLILVTHQVNITAITTRGVSSGEAEVFKLNGTGEPEFVGTIEPPR